MSINLQYVEGTSEKLGHLPRSHKIRSTFHTESTYCKLLYTPKDGIATEDKDSIVYETDRSNCKVVYFGESKRSLKLRPYEQERPVKNCDCKNRELQNTVGKQITTLGGIRRKLLIGKGGEFLQRSNKPYIL